MPATVNLVSRDNGVGLTTDMELMAGILTGAGYDVQRVNWRDPIMRICDVGIFLELWSPRLGRFARRTVGVFNLEWFMPSWRSFLPTFDQLWAKSTEAYETLTGTFKLGNVTLTGFSGQDLYDPAVERELTCLHLRGHSGLKGTDAILRAWQANPDLPPLTVVSAAPLPVPPGVRLLLRQPREDLAREMNRAVIHVCPSESEGFGHYIAEALSVGAVVVTTDAPPMNEHVRPEWGYLLPARDGAMHDLARLHLVDSDDIAEAVRAAASLPVPARTEMGELAQVHFHVRNRDFAKTALDLIGRL